MDWRNSFSVRYAFRVDTNPHMNCPSRTQYDLAMFREGGRDVEGDASSAAQCQVQLIAVDATDSPAELMR